jgi:uncharacterized lipoprotein YddW (UPF0748 family)
VTLGLSCQAANPKREFRGAWLHTVFQDQYLRQSTAQNKRYLINQLDSLKLAGVNAIIFQVRPQSDAFYDSKLEPWSRFLTNGGKAPQPYWDPLQFMIDECHNRGMELHAWLNPYRVTSSAKQTLPASHIYHKHPERFIRYDRKLYFDPGLPENRKFIEDVVLDIVTRYDVDGIHFDDYFYPYPVKGQEFDDSKSFAKYGKGMKLSDWRRHNVDQLISELHEKIREAKPWVIFGISPFGIWRNKKTDPRGSDTNGLQNYDALYADVLLWAEKGWIDYLLPQLYWDLEHKSASYLVLVEWWNRNACGRHLYVGQDVARTMKYADIPPSNEKNQLRHKIELTRDAAHIQGNCWWPGYAVTRNEGGVADLLHNDFQSTIALCPTYPWISNEKPEAVTSLKHKDGKLTWTAPKAENKVSDITKFVIYHFKDSKSIDLEDSAAIIAVTNRYEYEVSEPGTYIVTALDRVNNESEPTKINIK